jgi:hypothetical protein
MKIEFDAWCHLSRTADVCGQTQALHEIVSDALLTEEYKDLLKEVPDECKKLVRIKDLTEELLSMLRPPKNISEDQRACNVVHKEKWVCGDACLARASKRWLEAEFLAIDQANNCFVVTLAKSLETVFVNRIKRPPTVAKASTSVGPSDTITSKPKVERKVRSDAKVAIDQKRSWQEFQKKLKK